jgi:outer membrane protein
MTRITRAMAAFGLGAGALGLLAGHTIGQDAAVQKTSNQGASRTMTPAVVGSIDMDAVFKGYEKVEFLRKQIEAEANLKKAELSKIMAEAQQVAKEMESLTPGSPDFKGHDARLTEYRAKLNASREQAQAEFAQKEADALATIYKEVQAMVEAVAKHNHMTYVIRVSNEPITGADPNSALAAMSRSVVYSDPATDVTQIVIRLLNRQYQAAGGKPAAPTTAAAAPAGAQPQPAPAPAAATQPPAARR